MKYLILSIALLVVTNIFAQKEQYNEKDVEDALLESLENFFNATSINELFKLDEQKNIAIANQDFLYSLKSNGEFYDAEIGSTFFPEDLRYTSKTNLTYLEFMDTLAYYFPFSADKRAQKQGNNLYTRLGEVSRSINFRWNSKDVKSIYNSFYFNNLLFITVDVSNIRFNSNYFNADDMRCFRTMGNPIVRKDTIALVDAEWFKDESGREFTYLYSNHKFAIDNSPTYNFKAYKEYTESNDTLFSTIERSGVQYKENLVVDYIILTDTLEQFEPDYLRWPSKRIGTHYFTFVLELPSIRNWNSTRITTKLLKVSDEIQPIKKIVGDYLKFNNTFHLELALTNKQPILGTNHVAGNLSPGFKTLLNFRYNERPYGLTIGVKTGVEYSNNGVSLSNFNSDKLFENQDFEFGQIDLNYSADIPGLVTSWSSVEFPLLVNAIYKPTIGGQDINFELDFSIGYKYGLILNETISAVDVRSKIETTGIYYDESISEILELRDIPELGLSIYDADYIVQNIENSLNKTYSNLVFGFSPHYKIRNDVTVFLDFSYELGLTNRINDIEYIHYYAGESPVVFDNPLFTKVKNEKGYKFNTMQFSFGVTIPISR